MRAFSPPNTKIAPFRTDAVNPLLAVGKGSSLQGKKSLEELKEDGEKLLGKLDEKTLSGYPPIIIGKELAGSLGVIIGDEINLVSPFGKIGPLGHLPKVRKFEVIAIFDYGMFEYDSSISYVSIKDAMKFFDMKNKVSGIELKTDNAYDAKSLGSELKDYLGFPFYTRNWQDVNQSLFRALKLERIAIGIFLAFIILVAALDIISTLTMVVMDAMPHDARLQDRSSTQGGPGPRVPRVPNVRYWG